MIHTAVEFAKLAIRVVAALKHSKIPKAFSRSDNVLT